MEYKLDCQTVLSYLREKGYKRTDIELIEELLKAKKSEENDKKKTN
jgi:hypothetical protein